MTQPASSALMLGLRGCITGISWLPRTGIIAALVCSQITATMLQDSPAIAENSRYRKYCIWPLSR